MYEGSKETFAEADVVGSIETFAKIIERTYRKRKYNRKLTNFMDFQPSQIVENNNNKCPEQYNGASC